MSFNRENVTWQSANGTWNTAFYEVTWVGDPADGYDPEWDVEYDMQRFSPYNTAQGCASEDQAYAVATRHTSNPGGTSVIENQGNEALCERLDLMLKDARQRRD
jgi:hypothetical protein